MIIKWGIIGCGDVCEVKSGPAFYKCEGSALRAVMRRNKEKAADFAKRHSVPVYYSNVDDLLNDPEIDAVYIATPPASHCDLTIRSLQAGKPVYVEKPMAVDYSECLLMNKAAKENNQKLWVAYYRRSLPYFLKVKELLDKNTIGKVLIVKNEFLRPALLSDKKGKIQTWRVDKEIAGGGYFYDMASHTIDIFLFLFGKITHAKGVVSNRGNYYDVEDTVSVSFIFESGIVGSGVWCYVSPENIEKDHIEIIGEKGTIQFSTFSFSPIELRTNYQTETFSFERPEHIQQDMILAITDELNGKGEAPSTGESGAMTNWVIDQIFEH